MDNLPLYKAVLNGDEIIDEDLGLSFISLVENPAIESKWIAMNETKKILYYEFDKQEITGAALIPDKKIFRRDENGMEYNIVWDKETIKQAAISFFKNSKGITKTTLEHSEESTKGIILFESWIKESESDKSVSLFSENFPIGTWFVTMKVLKDNIWKDIKAGKYQGFSIEAFIMEKLVSDKRPKLQLSKEQNLDKLLTKFNEYKTIYK